MTIADTTTPTRSRRPQRTRRRAVQPRPRHRLLFFPRHRATSRLRVPQADSALNFLMQEADIFRIGRRDYLVAPLCYELVEILIIAAGATEDDEENGDLEPSIEPSTGYAGEDLELAPGDDDGEPSLGWADTGPQLRLTAGYHGGSDVESDGNCDDEPDHEGDPLDDGECDGLGVLA